LGITIDVAYHLKKHHQQKNHLTK